MCVYVVAGPCNPSLHFFFAEEILSYMYLYSYGSILRKPEVKSPAWKGLTSLLLLVMLIVFSLLSHVVSWVRCGI